MNLGGHSARDEGRHDEGGRTRTASIATGLLSIGTIIGCLALPPMAERIGRKLTLAVYFVGMAGSIALAFGWAFYLGGTGLVPFIAFAGGARVSSAAILRCSACGCRSSFETASSDGVCFLHIDRTALRGHRELRDSGVRWCCNMKTLGVPIALTAVAFLIGLGGDPFAPGNEGAGPAELGAVALVGEVEKGG